jgi:hypothetical protein
VSHPSILLNALVGATLRACSDERELAWSKHDTAEGAARQRVIRDRAVQAVERVLKHAVDQHVISGEGARNLTGHVYDALAAQRRAVNRQSYPTDPVGHWQAVDAITHALVRTWRRDRLKRWLGIRK